jgi:hypothetical protein
MMNQFCSLGMVAAGTSLPSGEGVAVGGRRDGVNDQRDWRVRIEK